MRSKTHFWGTIHAIILIAAAMCLSLTGCGSGRTQIDLSDYIVFSAEGYDTFGYADCWFNAQAYQEDVYAILNEKGIWEGNKYSDEKRELAEVLLSAYYTLALSKTSGLSNGDKVEITTEYEKDKYKSLGITLTGGNESKEISGLQPLKQFDPFEELRVSFNGASPLCTVSLTGTEDGLTYSASQDANLVVGDTITISVSYNGGKDLTEFTRQTGLVPTATEKTYTVQNVPRYPGNIAEIPDAMKLKMDKVVRDDIKKMETSDWEGYYELVGIDFMGYYYRTPKRINLYQETDYKLYMVYKIKVVLENGDPYEFYNYWCFEDITILPDGTCTCNLDNYRICEDEVHIIEATPKATNDGYEPWYYTYYRGCKTIDAIFNTQIAKYSDMYDYESTVKDGAAQPVTGNSQAASQGSAQQESAGSVQQENTGSAPQDNAGSAPQENAGSATQAATDEAAYQEEPANL